MIGVTLNGGPWALIHWDGADVWTAAPQLRDTFRTRKEGLKVRCTNGHTTKCCTVQPYNAIPWGSNWQNVMNGR